MMINVYVGSMPEIHDGINALSIDKKSIPYLRARSDILVNTLKMEGFRIKDEDLLLEVERLSLDEASARAKNDWRLLESLSYFFQDVKPGLYINTQFHHLGIAALESILHETSPKKGKMQVYYRGDFLSVEGIKLLFQVCELYDADLHLFYAYYPHKYAVISAERVVWGSTMVARDVIENILGINVKTWEMTEIRGNVALSHSNFEIKRQHFLLRHKKINFLRKLWGNRADEYFGLLKEIVESGSIAEKSILEIGDAGIFLGLLKHGFIMRNQSGLIMASEKGLEAYLRYRSKKDS